MEIRVGRYALVTSGLMKDEIVKILLDKTDSAVWVIVQFDKGGEIALPKESLKVIG